MLWDARIKLTKAVIHLGVHKTGTTQLQSTLKINRQALADESIISPTRSALNPLSKAVRSAKRGEEEGGSLRDQFGAMYRGEIALLKQEAGRPDLVISDEDMLGMPNLARKEVLYPKAFDAVSLLAKVVEVRQRLWLITIRDLADFIESSYVQQLKMGAHLSMPAYLKRFPAVDLKWSELLQRIAKAVPNSDILSVHLYDGRNTNPKLIGNICDFLGRLPLPETPPSVANPGYSEKGIALARAANRALDTNEDKRRVRRFIERSFFVEPGEEKPRLIDQKLRETLADNMRSDLDSIRDLASDRIRINF